MIWLAMSRLDFWFDFGSTYSYPAVMRIEAEAAKKGVAVGWNVLLLGPIFAKHGLNTSPYKANPVKGAYMWRDLERLAVKYGLPFKQPPEFPQNGLLAARVALVLDPDDVPAFSREVFLYEFGEGGVISDDAPIRAVLTKLGHDADAVVAKAQAEDNKLALRLQVEHAASLGIFGAPTFVTKDGELFWGHDRLDDALEWAVRTSSTSGAA
jgi:2-hydroxychromene-2-carboxylate isomerase